MNIYEIDRALSLVIDELSEKLANGETLTESDEERLLSVGDKLENKLISYGYVVKNTQGELDAVKAEIDRLNAKKAVLDKKAYWLKRTMQTVMTSHNLSKIDDPIMPIRLQDSPVSVAILDEKALPPDYQKVTITADKKALISDLKQGKQIDGVSLVQNQHVRIG